MLGYLEIGVRFMLGGVERGTNMGEEAYSSVAFML